MLKIEKKEKLKHCHRNTTVHSFGTVAEQKCCNAYTSLVIPTA